MNSRLEIRDNNSALKNYSKCAKDRNMSRSEWVRMVLGKEVHKMFYTSGKKRFR